MGRGSGKKPPGYRSRPIPTSRLFGGLARQFQLGPALQVLKAWPEIAGPLVSAQLKAVRFAEGILWVRAEQSVWGHQLTFLRPELLRKLENALGKPLVQDIRLTTARPAADMVAAPEPGAQAPPPPGAVASRPVEFAELSPAELADIEARASEHIRDPELAKRWARLEARIRSAQLAHKQAGRPSCLKCGLAHPGPGKLCPVCFARSRPSIAPGAPPAT